MGPAVLAFIVDALITIFCIFVASKLVFLDARWRALLGVILLVSLMSLVPYVGWVLSVCLFIWLLASISQANVAQCVPVALVTKLLALGGVVLVQGAATV